MRKDESLIPQYIHDYIEKTSLRETQLLQDLREETAKNPAAIMQIPPEQGQLMALLVKLMGAKRSLEIGTFTGYSALAVALAMPDDSYTVCCDISEEWTSVGKKYWQEAGVADKIELRLAPALETLDQLIEEGHSGSFDFAFIDADKANYIAYYEKTLTLLRVGGLIAFDNVLLFGSAADDQARDQLIEAGMSADDVDEIRRLNIILGEDERVDISMLPIADGLTLARKR